MSNSMVLSALLADGSAQFAALSGQAPFLLLACTKSTLEQINIENVHLLWR